MDRLVKVTVEFSVWSIVQFLEDLQKNLQDYISWPITNKVNKQHKIVYWPHVWYVECKLKYL